MKRIILPLLVFALFCITGCTREAEKVLGDDFFRAPDITPVRKVLKAAMPLGYAANLTMATLRGAHFPNVIMARSGSDTSTGCFLMYIAIDSSFPLPGNVKADGRIIMAGFSADNKTAIMTAVFTEMNVRQGTFALRDISTFPVVMDSNIITGKKELLVVYADMDVNTGSDTLLTTGLSQSQMTSEMTKFQTMKSFDSGVTLDENAWIVKVDNNNTLSNAYDDKYVINGFGQYVEVSNSKSEIVQLTMIKATLTPACKNNPSDGWAFWQNVGAGTSNVEIGHVFLTYHNRCDGNAEITVATGVYATSFGTAVALKLGE